MELRAKFFFLLLILNFGLAECLEPEYIRYADKISSRVATQIEKEFNLHCSGEGGSMPYNVGSVYLKFQARRRATLEEARAIHTRCTELLMKAFNEDEAIRPFLAEYPFPASRVNIALSFGQPINYWLCDGTICHVFGAHSKIFYSISDPIDTIMTSFYEESHEDALKIVQASKLTNADLRFHREKPYEPLFDKFIEAIVPQISKKWGLSCVKVGGNIRDGIEEFAFSFLRKKPTSLEEARELEIAIIDFLVSSINKNEELKPYLKSCPLKEDRIRVHLLFGEREYREFRDGVSLSEVLPSKGRLLYYRLPPNEPSGAINLTPQVVSNESYEESRQHLYLLKKK